MDAKHRLLDRVPDRIRVKHYSYRTEQQYVAWIRRFVLFHSKRHPAEMGSPELETFLSHLATVRNVAASTQNQALSALLFLYKEVLGIDLPWLKQVTRPTKPVACRSCWHKMRSEAYWPRWMACTADRLASIR